MIAYFDASALVKRYVEEAGREEVVERLDRDLAATSRLTETEIVSALARRCREGIFSANERDRIMGAVRRDFANALFVSEVTDRVILQSRELLVRHPLRAADAVQLASALALAEELRLDVAFLAFDERLLEAARSEGLETGP